MDLFSAMEPASPEITARRCLSRVHHDSGTQLFIMEQYTHTVKDGIGGVERFAAHHH
jgi:hypothetical protein